MRIIQALLLLFTVFVVAWPLESQAQGQANHLSVEALFLDPPKAGVATRLWLKITNKSDRAQILCRSSWGYTWISDDPQEEPAIEETSSLHGCGDKDHDPLWLLLPGQSRFDSYEVIGPAGLNSTLEVDVHVIQSPLAWSGPNQHFTLSWKGRVADAIGLGAKLKAK